MVVPWRRWGNVSGSYSSIEIQGRSVSIETPETPEQAEAPESETVETAATEAADEVAVAAEEVQDDRGPIVVDDLGDDLEAWYAASMVSVEDGQLITGTVVKIDRDEVLLDIGFKTEGVIPVRELSIRNEVDPNEVVSLGEQVEALVLTKEDKDGRLVMSKKRAQYERAWGTIEGI